MPPVLTKNEDLRSLLERSPRIAMIGASSNPMRDSNKIFRFLQEQGFEMTPITPSEEEIHGARAYPTLQKAVEDGHTFDLVSVFRRKDAALGIAKEVLQTQIPAVWYQLETHDAQATRLLESNGRSVVENQCILIKFRELHMEPRTGHPKAH